MHIDFTESAVRFLYDCGLAHMREVYWLTLSALENGVTATCCLGELQHFLLRQGSDGGYKALAFRDLLFLVDDHPERTLVVSVEYLPLRYVDAVQASRHVGVHVTRHAFERFSQRTSLHPSEISTFVAHALRFGKVADEQNGPLQSYLHKKEAKGLTAVTFQGLVLLCNCQNRVPEVVTVYALPEFFKHILPPCQQEGQTRGKFKTILYWFKKWRQHDEQC